MNCNEVLEHIGEILDRDAPARLREAFFSHIELCHPCRNQYEIESLARGLVRSRLKRVPPPPDVVRSIINALPAEDNPPPGRAMESIFRSKILAPAFSAGLAILILFFFLSGPLDDSSTPSGNDIIRHSQNNFNLIQSGELRPSMIACYPEIIVGYFKNQGTDFAVSVFSDDSCEWYGAIADTYRGINVAHIVYKRGNDLLYVLEMRKGEALQGSILSLPEEAKQALAATGWYTKQGDGNGSVILWTADETLCAAVSTMGKERLLAFLTTQQSIL